MTPHTNQSLQKLKVLLPMIWEAIHATPTI